MSYFRHPHTTQERRFWDDEYGRRNRAPVRLPNYYDDVYPRSRRDRSWKRFRDTRYKVISFTPE